jgi:hypothetical protein
MKTVSGICRFCKQIAVVQIPDDKEFDQKRIDDIASSECKCTGAQEERKIGYLADDARSGIRRILEDKDQISAAKIMLSAVDPVARGRIKKVSVNIDGEMTCSMYLKSARIIVESRRTLVEYSDGETIEE